MRSRCEDRNQRSMTFHQVRIVVGNQAPSACLFDPYPCKAILLGYDFVCVLALHRREACLHRGVAVYADSNLVSRDRLELQASRCEIGEDIFFRSDCSARADPDEVLRVDSVERHRIGMDLRLNALSIRFSDLLDNASRALVPGLRMSRNGAISRTLPITSRRVMDTPSACSRYIHQPYRSFQNGRSGIAQHLLARNDQRSLPWRIGDHRQLDVDALEHLARVVRRGRRLFRASAMHSMYAAVNVILPDSAMFRELVHCRCTRDSSL
jgi:hypothetical protein